MTMMSKYEQIRANMSRYEQSELFFISFFFLFEKDTRVLRALHYFKKKKKRKDTRVKRRNENAQRHDNFLCHGMNHKHPN
jgi:hypothetical protein